MIRFLLSLVILTLILTYLVIPFVKYLKKFFKHELKRIDNAFDEENELSKKQENTEEKND